MPKKRIIKKRNKPEKCLENWLAKNLHRFEKGLELRGQQFRYTWRNEYKHVRYDQIDIIALDRNNVSVLIEVKIKAESWSLTQLQEYMANFIVKPNRGIIAALRFSQTLLKQKLPPNIEFWHLDVEVPKWLENDN